ncbi:hypothetical protein AB0C34_07465 [Nocardia sp. NPDC049220]|uniref:hypothetical protein n=1 Tax=Nocardia sp. NPDC049220 TaxID=3155273 RepID=UPI0034106582
MGAREIERTDSAFSLKLDELRSSAQRVAGDDENHTPHLVARSESANSIFVGVVHYTKPDHPQSKAFGKIVHDWLDHTNGHDRIFRIEGRVGEAGRTEEASLAAHGDTGRLAYLANKHGVPIGSLEENFHDQALWLIQEKGHDPETVFGYYVLRRIPQALRAQEGYRPDIEAHLRETMIIHSTFLPDDVDAGEVFKRVMGRLYSERGKSPFEFDVSDEDWLLRETGDPSAGGPVETPIQKVAADTHDRRRSYAVQLIREDMAEGKDVFGIFGDTHFFRMASMMKNEFPARNVTALEEAQ